MPPPLLLRPSEIDCNTADIEWENLTEGRELWRIGAVTVKLRQNETGAVRLAVKTIESKTEAFPGYGEAMAFVRGLRHPAIIRIHRMESPHFTHPGRIVMDFAMNGSLSDNFARLKGRPTKFAIVVMGIVLGMRFLHSRDLIHRGLEPSHILLDSEFRVRLTGFGRSLLGDSSINLRGESMDAHYSAPEAWENVGQTAKVDSFSFGLILFELLTGAPVFRPSLNPRQVLKRVQYWRPPIPKEIPEVVRELIYKCWSNDPSERPTFFKIFRRLRRLEYKLVAGVNCGKVCAYVKGIQKYENESQFCSMEYALAARASARLSA
jgi:serine/threonine protein kinase